MKKHGLKASCATWIHEARVSEREFVLIAQQFMLVTCGEWSPCFVPQERAPRHVGIVDYRLTYYFYLVGSQLRENPIDRSHYIQ
jgi:hypothetical protein